jgi:hypothetical protein
MVVGPGRPNQTGFFCTVEISNDTHEIGLSVAQAFFDRRYAERPACRDIVLDSDITTRVRQELSPYGDGALAKSYGHCTSAVVELDVNILASRTVKIEIPKHIVSDGWNS